MRIFHLIHAIVGQAFYAWALREINPTHEDVPRIVRRKHYLCEKEQRLWLTFGA